MVSVLKAALTRLAGIGRFGTCFPARFDLVSVLKAALHLLDQPGHSVLDLWVWLSPRTLTQIMNEMIETPEFEKWIDALLHLCGTINYSTSLLCYVKDIPRRQDVDLQSRILSPTPLFLLQTLTNTISCQKTPKRQLSSPAIIQPFKRTPTVASLVHSRAFESSTSISKEASRASSWISCSLFIAASTGF